MSKIFVTGTNGFLGGYVAEELNRRGHEVFGLIRKHPDFLKVSNNIKLLVGDLNSKELIYSYLSQNNISIIIHTAALVSDWDSKSKFYETNVTGTENLLDAAKRANIKAFINISTIDVMHYSRKKHNILLELTDYTNSKHHYQRTKTIAEVRALELTSYFKVITLRPAWIFGPKDKILFPEIIRSLNSGILPFPGKGDAYIPLIYVENLTNFIADIVDEIHILPNTLKINLSDDTKITWMELINLLMKNFNPKSKIIHTPYFIAYIIAFIFQFFYHIFKIKNRPPLTTISLTMLTSSIEVNNGLMKKYSKTKRVPFEEAMRRTIEWFRVYHSVSK